MTRLVVVVFLSLVMLTAARAVEAQQTGMPAIGFLRSTPFAPFAHLVTAFREGLSEAGFIEGQNVTIEYRWANNQLDRLPGLAARSGPPPGGRDHR